MRQIVLPFLLLVICSGAPVQDLVTMKLTVNYTLPWYSGYLNFTMGKFHYVYFESQKTPSSDPLVLWLNGGPGCSSLIGMVYENGPFIFQPNTTQFKLNPNAWNKQANLLYITSPGGVGFSLGSRRVYDDGNTAEDNLAALLQFFKKFPELRKSDFYLTGQSYSGIYVPYLAHQIIKYNKLPSSKDTKISLKGIMVGNACTDPRQCYDATAQGNSMFQYQFLYEHGYYTDRDYNHLRAACVLAFQSEQCQKMRTKFDDLFAVTNSSILNIYAPCYYNEVEKGKKWKIRQSGRKTRLTSDMDCDDSKGIHQFFNRIMIPEELHVQPLHFQQCSDFVADTYVSFANASYWIYPLLMKEGIRTWVYSGDVDADVPITGTLVWIQRLKEEFGLPTEDPWRQWWVHGLHKHEDQVGGMVWQIKDLTFVSIKGAGHMVPKDKSKQAWVLLNKFLKGEQMPQKKQ